MRDFLIIYASLFIATFIGWRARGRYDEMKAAREKARWPEHLPVEFTQWLHDYIVVNTPRRD